jgi:quercetin dioxygenase-like cupin family protein
MEPFVMRPPREIASGNAPYRHRGEELIYVLRGKIELTLGDDQVMLAAGDSVYFDASVPHRARALSAGAEALVVVAPRN